MLFCLIMAGGNILFSQTVSDSTHSKNTISDTVKTRPVKKFKIVRITDKEVFRPVGEPKKNQNIPVSNDSTGTKKDD